MYLVKAPDGMKYGFYSLGDAKAHVRKDVKYHNGCQHLYWQPSKKRRVKDYVVRYKKERQTTMEKTLRLEAGTCPNCGVSGLEYPNGFDVDENLTKQVHCEECGFEGHECYTVAFNEFTDFDGNGLKTTSSEAV